MVSYEVDQVSQDMSFLEMLDVLNERLTHEGEDPIAFAKLLAVMDANPKLRAKLIERGRERVRDFAPERTRPAILDSLRVLLARAPSLRVVGGGR